MDVSLPGITQMSFGLTTALRYSLDMRANHPVSSSWRERNSSSSSKCSRASGWNRHRLFCGSFDARFDIPSHSEVDPNASWGVCIPLRRFADLKQTILFDGLSS